MTTNTVWKQILNLESREVISLVGGGGKTTLMFALAKQLSQSFNVISTTTTKIFYPSPQETSIIKRGCRSSKEISFTKGRHITIIDKILPNSKVCGFSPQVVDSWVKETQVDYVIVEADGSRRCDVKWPDTKKEPVIPQSTTTVIAVLGGDCFGKTLEEKNVFRAELFAQKTQMNIGQPLNLHAISRLFLDQDGLFAHSPQDAKKIVFINKIQSNNRIQAARNLANIICKNSQNIKIIYGHLHPYISVKEFLR
ncbi:selenium cofactor biosynthesis protein YqeC [Candidatus Uabimicrobium amorphum]|uniref:Selenium-dependent hydroxylase accessory protein YqeC n=1 Tax=Uabimicrobium amorphum TaxID=2596890 RepID=A0A5S9IL16_UABAM|nr:selenium cofactor biosynthesis protein YqeC [Candidatus Uabimicrobium amorphum]BBM83500.1 hypothetical protein UABAM_01852 [Candidatus Uabimicrobium amorphum]